MIKGYKMKNDWLMNDKLIAMYINVMVDLDMLIENKKDMILKYNIAKINAKRNGASFKDEKEVVDLIITALEGIVLSKEEEKMVIEAVNSATIEYKINSLQG